MKHISEIITDSFIDHMVKDATRGWEQMKRADETLPPPDPPMEELNQQIFIEQWVEENNRIKTVQVQENHEQKEKNVSIKRPTNRTAITRK